MGCFTKKCYEDWLLLDVVANEILLLWQVVLLGSAPDPRIQNDFVNLANELHSSYPDRARLCLTYDEPLSHLVCQCRTQYSSSSSFVTNASNQ